MHAPAIWTPSKTLIRPPSLLPLPKERGRRFGFPRGPRGGVPKHASFISPGNPNPHRGFNYLAGDPGADPFFLDVIFSSHWDVTGTGTLDNSQYGSTIAASLFSGVTGAQFVFGDGSLNGPGNAAQYVRYTNNAANLFMNGSITWEGFVRRTVGGVIQVVSDITEPTTADYMLAFTAGNVLNIFAHGTTYNFGVTTVNQWAYFALCGAIPFNGQASGYLDDGLTGTATRVINSATGWQTPIVPLTVPSASTFTARVAGGVGIGQVFTGQIDEFRVTASLIRNVSRYSGATIPTPTVPFVP